MSYQLRLEKFEGPFDLLLHLIEQNEMDIYDIKIADITQQYLDYLQEMEKLDLEVASEFLVMAAKLLYIKARMLLPKEPIDIDMGNDEPEEDPELALLRDLLEYKRIKLAAEMLDARGGERSLSYTRQNDEAMYAAMFAEKNPLDGKTLDDLTVAFSLVFRKAQRRDIILSIKKEGITIGDMMTDVVDALRKNDRGVEFSSLFENDQSRTELVIRFLAILELTRRGIIRIQQGATYGEIYLFAADLERFKDIE